jgi:hypothetical protein
MRIPEVFSMADNVKEEIVIKRRQALTMLMYVIIWITMLVSALIGSIMLMSILNPSTGGINWGGVIGLVVFGGGAVLMWVGKDYLRVEYEYSFTNGVVDIAQVINNRRRKELVSFKTREVEYVAPIDDPKLHNFESRPNLKKIKAVLNADSDIYFASFRKNEVQYLLYFEPSKEFLQFMRIYNDRNVII